MWSVDSMVVTDQCQFPVLMVALSLYITLSVFLGKTQLSINEVVGHHTCSLLSNNSKKFKSMLKVYEKRIIRQIWQNC